jgi:CHAD domain-containing protein
MTDPAPPTTGELIPRLIRAAVADVEATEAGALADEPDGLHEHRTRVRRLRSVLAGFGRLADRRTADALAVRWREWGTELGVARDSEVRADVASDALERLGIDDPAVRERLVEVERAAYSREHARVVELAASARAEARRRESHDFARDPGVADPSADAASAVAEVLARQARRVRRAARRLDGSEEAYHRVRKAGRRLRYVALAVAEADPGLRPEAVHRLAKAGAKIQHALGRHRDDLLFAQHVARQSAIAAHAGEPTDAYAVIEAEARASAAENLAVLPSARKRLKKATALL